jgi:hypothetical protein
VIHPAVALVLAGLLGSCNSGGPEGERLARAMNLPVGIGAGGCGIDDPVLVHAVGTIQLSPPARINCQTATALKHWSETGARQAAKSVDRRIARLRVAASYACRRRNNARSGRISEHSRGNAIDISQVTFANGDTASVLKNWNSGPYSKTLQKMHKSACGPFGVVLGPKADRHHRDHFHFDTSNMNRRYCR